MVQLSKAALQCEPKYGGEGVNRKRYQKLLQISFDTGEPLVYSRPIV